MPLPTQPVTCRFYDQSGNPAVGARVLFRLTVMEIYDGIVAPELVEASTDANGECVVSLFPNALGSYASQYQVRAWSAEDGKKIIDSLCTVPDQACLLHEILNLEPYPPIDSALQAMLAAQSALSDVTNQRLLAETAATSAASDAAVASSSATSASASATAASGYASSAAGSASAANGYASSAEGSAIAADASADAAAAAASASVATLTLDLASTIPGAGSDMIGFKQSGSGAVARTALSKLRDVVSLRDFGAVGDGVTDDTAAVSAAVTYVLGVSRSPELRIPSGLYKITAMPTLTNAITFKADNPRDTQFMLSGASTIINIAGSGSRATDVVFDGVGINGAAMTGGYCVAIDWAQNVLFNNVLFNDPYNGVYARQVGSVTFRDCEFDYVRGTVGVNLYGDNTTRNGENDQIDLVIFDSTVVQSNLPASGGSSSVVLLRVDGRVHTIHTDGLRLLNGGIGLQAKNTPALAANLVPRFLIGSSLEVENMHAECLDLQAFREFTPAFLFAVGSHTADGVKLSPSVARFAPGSCSINGNQLHGLNTNGASSVVLKNPLIYNNSLVGSATKSGVYASGSGVLTVDGGLIGKETSLPSYTENQKHGIELDGAFSGRLLANGVDLRNNATGAIYDNGTTATGSQVASCPGYNPGGPLIQVVGASPYSYTAGLAQEAVSIYGGTGVVSTIGGTVVANQSPCSFILHPRQTVSISYATAPTMAVNKA